jgi:hypothetical protein
LHEGLLKGSSIVFDLQDKVAISVEGVIEPTLAKLVDRIEQELPSFHERSGGR